MTVAKGEEKKIWKQTDMVEVERDGAEDTDTEKYTDEA